RVVKRWPIAVELGDPFVHFLREHHFECARCRTAELGIGKRDLAEKRGIGKIAPARRSIRNAQSAERLAVIANTETGKTGSDPAPPLVPKRHAPQSLRDSPFTEELRVASNDPGVDQPPGPRMSDELVAATTEQQIDADACVGLEKDPPCELLVVWVGTG